MQMITATSEDEIDRNMDRLDRCFFVSPDQAQDSNPDHYFLK